MPAHKRLRTWIVIADGARARFLVPSEDARRLVAARLADMVAPESRGHARDLKRDRPGRSYASARSGLRHAVEPKHDPHKLEKHRFAASLAEALDDACARGEVDQIVLAAPRRSLGELRGLLSARVRHRIRQEIAKDLTNDTAAALWRRLGPLVKPIL
ncbi:MAG: host attachment protein [Reyranella sp.]|nr:host attachment protein [Reyranella sp.]